MNSDRPIRLGLMGFGQIGRQIYDLAGVSDDIEIVAIADIGKPDILHYLLCSEVAAPERYRIEGNYLVNERFRARMMPADGPAEMPWDVFGVDLVIDATGEHREARDMEAHLASGAPRVLIRTLPADRIDRIVVPAINGDTARREDRMLSAGSATTTALALLLDILAGHFAIDCVSMTTIHAYTSDQSLQDYAGSDFRRSRSAAENIIPNSHEAARWIGAILPAFAGKVMSSALNVPVQDGCLLDANLVLDDSGVTPEQVNEVMRNAVARYPGIIAVAEDPIVSSDVIGNPHSLVFDAKGTTRAGSHIIKTLAWYDTLGHAGCLLEVARLYAMLDREEAAR